MRSFNSYHNNWNFKQALLESSVTFQYRIEFISDVGINESFPLWCANFFLK